MYMLTASPRTQKPTSHAVVTEVCDLSDLLKREYDPQAWGVAKARWLAMLLRTLAEKAERSAQELESAGRTKIAPPAAQDEEETSGPTKISLPKLVARNEGAGVESVVAGIGSPHLTPSAHIVDHPPILAGLDAAQLKERGFGAGQLRASGFSAADLKQGGFDVHELKKGAHTREFRTASLCTTSAPARAATLRQPPSHLGGVVMPSFRDSKL